MKWGYDVGVWEGSYFRILTEHCGYKTRELAFQAGTKALRRDQKQTDLQCELHTWWMSDAEFFAGIRNV